MKNLLTRIFLPFSFVLLGLLVFASSVSATMDCTGNSFSFATFSDTYEGQEGGLQRVFNEIPVKDPNTHFLTTAGDNPTFQRVRGYVDSELTGSGCGSSFPWLPATGNHDAEDAPNMTWWANNWATNWISSPQTSRLATQLSGLTNFRRGPTQVRKNTTLISVDPGSIYSFDYKNAHFIIINAYEQYTNDRGGYSDSGSGVFDYNGPSVFDPTNSQLDWIKQDLQLNTKPIKFVFSHVALVAPLYLNSGCEPPLWSEHDSDFNTVELTNLLVQYNVTAFFNGHDHAPSRTLVDQNKNIVYKRWYCDSPGSTSTWESRQGPGTIWQVDSGALYTNTGNYVITKVSDTSVTFEIYEYNSSNPGSTQLWDTWTVPVSGGTTPPPSAPTLTLSASPSTIAQGQSSTLSWSTTNATSCSAGGGWSGTKSTSGSQVVSPTVTASYALTCTGGGGSVTKSVTVAVGTVPPPSGQKGDLNSDSKVDVTDLGILLSNWGKTTKPPADINQDGRVDVIDLGILLSNWGGSGITPTPTPTPAPSPTPTPTPPPTSGGIIYVDPQIDVSSCATYSPSSRSCSGGSARAYKDLNSASGAASPGNTVFVRQGTYTGQFAPQKSGIAGSPITFKNYQGETVTLTGTTADNSAIYLLNRSYLVIDGFRVSDVFGWGRIENSDHNIFQNNRFSIATDSGTRSGLKLIASSYNRVLNNTFDDGNDELMFENGADRNVVQGNTFTQARHTLFNISCSNYNIIRGNTFKNVDQKGGEVFDCEGMVEGQPYKLDATKHNIIENNAFAGTRASSQDYDYNAIQYSGQIGIVRKNVFYDNLGGGLHFQVYSDEALYNYGHRAYNNTFYNNRCYAIQDSSESTSARYNDNVVKNNLLYRNYDCGGAANQTDINNSNTTVMVSNAITTASPLFVNEAGRDFHLQSGSPQIDAAAFLTQTASAGSGTSLKVQDAKYFYDGYGIPGETGDVIRLAGQTATARVVSVDYTNNILTLDRSLTWGAGQGVSLSYNGSAPDMGAFEF